MYLMGIKYIPVKDIPVSEVTVSPKVIAVIIKQGLIEPLVRMPDGTIHPHHQQHMEAFRSLTTHITSTVIIVDWEDLTPNERRGI